MQKSVFLFLILFSTVAFSQNDSLVFDLIPTAELDSTKIEMAEAENLFRKFNDATSKEEYENVVSMLSDVIDKGLKDAFTFYIKAQCEMYEKHYVNAISDFTQAIKLNNPKFHDLERKKVYYKVQNGYTMDDDTYPLMEGIYTCYHYRGECKRFMKDYRGAIDDYIKSLFLKPDGEVYLVKALCEYNLQKYSEGKLSAIKYLNMVKEIDPQIYIIKGLCNINLHLKESACKDWSKAGELGIDEAYDYIQKYCN